MSIRKFTIISPAVFQSPRYLSVGSEARELFFYCLAGPHQTMIGCFRAPELYIASDLKWHPGKVRDKLEELKNAGLIDFDPETQEIMVHRWFGHSQIATDKHMQGARRMIADIESDMIRELMEASFSVFEASRERDRPLAVASSDRNARLANTPLMKAQRQ